VRYLAFDQVGDVKITWELNRHQHFVTLAKAYRLTNDPRFISEVVHQWRSWHAANPYPIGVNWASSLEVAMRSLSWIWVYFLLEGSPDVDAGFITDCVRSLAVNGRHIERYLSTYFSPNSHLHGEAVALFFIGTLFPKLRSAERWRKLGWKILIDEAKRQVRPDGMHFEQSTYYHVYAVDLFLHSMILANLNDVQIPADFENTVLKMLEALFFVSRFGSTPKFGDEDGGRLFDPLRNRDDHMIDPLSTGAIIFGRPDLKSVAGHLREETIWLLGAAGAARWDELSSAASPPASGSLHAAGLYRLADEHGQLLIDAGPPGALHGGHGHADALSVHLRSAQRDLLIDPGTVEYIDAFGRRSAFRATRAHNTVEVDGQDQMQATDLFKWATLPKARADVWLAADEFDLFAGSHDGYLRLTPPVIHRRWVFSAKCGFWLIRDVVEGQGEHRLDVYWHLASELRRRASGPLAFAADSGDGLIMVLPQSEPYALEVAAGSWSPAYGVVEPATVVHYGLVAQLPREFCVVLTPVHENDECPRILTTIQDGQAGDMAIYEYSVGTDHFKCFFSKPGRTWTSGSYSSNAEFLCWKKSDDREDELMSYNGTWVEIDGRRFTIRQGERLKVGAARV
jgi:hypothetical protein